MIHSHILLQKCKIKDIGSLADGGHIFLKNVANAASLNITGDS